MQLKTQEKFGGSNMFKKFDGKKNRLELIEPEFIEGLGRILSFGAEKYEANNWKKASSPEDQQRIYGALQRHLLAYKKGEKLDPETGESHLYHACCNLMFLDYQDRMELKEPNEKTTMFENTEDTYPFPTNKTATTNVIRQGLKDNGYKDWKLLGYSPKGYAVLQNIMNARVILADGFADFVGYEKSGTDHNLSINRAELKGIK